MPSKKKKKKSSLEKRGLVWQQFYDFVSRITELQEPAQFSILKVSRIFVRGIAFIIKVFPDLILLSPMVALLKKRLDADLPSQNHAPVERSSFKTLLFLAAMATSRDQREAALGCIQERFQADCKLFGEARARKLMMRDLVISYWALVRSTTNGRIVKILKYFGLSYFIKYFLG